VPELLVEMADLLGVVTVGAQEDPMVKEDETTRAASVSRAMPLMTVKLFLWMGRRQVLPLSLVRMM